MSNVKAWEKFFEENLVFIIRFKFTRLYHKANKLASLIPMLVIAGFRGFIKKLYAVDPESVCWQETYQ